MPPTPPPEDVDAGLRALARILAPYLAEELRPLLGNTAPASPATGPAGIDAETAGALAQSLPRDVALRALVFFEAIAAGERVDSESLADWLGADKAEIAGLLLSPVKRAANRGGLGGLRLWDVLSQSRERTAWGDVRDAPAAAMLRDALRDEVRARRPSDLSAERPAPSMVFVWADPADTSVLKTGRSGSSTLRESGPGSRAVIYQGHDKLAIIGLFDQTDEPHPDDVWRWSAPGYCHRLPKPVPRADLLRRPELRRVFEPIQGRRRLRPAAQEELAVLIAQQYPDRQLPLFAGGSPTGGARRASRKPKALPKAKAVR